MLFYFDLFRKNICQNTLRSTNFKQKLRHQVVEAEAVEAVETEAIQKLPLPHPSF